MGCGVGIGFGGPLNLGRYPGVMLQNHCNLQPAFRRLFVALQATVHKSYVYQTDAYLCSAGLIPGLQQASQGLSAGLTSLSPLLGGTAATVRAAVRGLSVPGLDVGFGCGVGVGYGFGARLMVKPSVVEQVVKSGTQMMGEQGHKIFQYYFTRQSNNRT